MTHTRCQVLLVFILPLVVAIGVTQLIDSRYAAARSADGAPIAATRESDESVGLLDAQHLLTDSAAPAPLDPALTPWPLSAEALASERSHDATSEQPLQIPEPRSGLLLVLGLAGLAALRRARPHA
jgi:hypothetical protein